MKEVDILYTHLVRGNIDSSGKNVDSNVHIRSSTDTDYKYTDDDYFILDPAATGIKINITGENFHRNTSTGETSWTPRDVSRFTITVFFYSESLTGEKVYIRNTTITSGSVLDLKNFADYEKFRFFRFTVFSSNYTALYPSYQDPDTLPNDAAVIDCSQINGVKMCCEFWYLGDNDELYTDDLQEAPEKSYKKPYPSALWRVGNDGLLIHDLLPVTDVPEPNMWSVERNDVISVYDISEPQNGFDHNGLALLRPTECTSTKELNARWDLTLTHPIDDYGKWQYLVGQNILKVRGQLFRIDEQTSSIDESGENISVHAKHISYDLADIWVEYSGIGSYNSEPHERVINGTMYLDQLMSDRVKEYGYNEYQFELTANLITAGSGELSGEIRDQSVMGAIIGEDNCFVNRFGGELYRDNFQLNISPSMKNSRKNCFAIRYGADMTKISQKIDYSTWITHLICEDNYHRTWEVSYSGSKWIIHHHKTKRVHFTYSDMVSEETFYADCQAYWETVNTPTVTYEIEIANIKNDPKYADFLELQKFDIGDTGIIYCKQLGITTEQKIIAVKRNELTNEIISITLGNMHNSLIRQSYMVNTVSAGNTTADKQIVAVQEQMSAMELKMMRTWNGASAFTWDDIKKYKWKEVSG